MDDAIQNLADEQLARRAQAGDWASFDELIRRFEARIYRFALSCGGCQTDAQEIAQETFVSAYQHLDRFDAGRSFATWLFTIARRKCVDRSRRARPVCGEVIPDQTDAEDPCTLIARREAAENLWHTARRVLSEAQFQTLWLHYAEDLSVREVARVVCKTQPHVKVLLFRARKVLARELERHAAKAEVQSGGAGASWKAKALPVSGPVVPITHRNL